MRISRLGSAVGKVVGKAGAALPAAALGIFCIASFGVAQGPPPDAPPPGGPPGGMTSPANVARMSFVQGDVRFSNGNDPQLQPAVMNMPLMENSRLQTGEDGEAEIEFNDGSVARLTPNSGLQIVALDRDQVQIQQLSGLSYYEVNVGDGHPEFSVLLPSATAEPTSNSIFRVDLDTGVDVAMMTGSLRLDGAGVPPGQLTDGQSVHFDPTTSFAQFAVVQGFAPDSWDRWNDDRDQQIAEEAAQQSTERETAGGGDAAGGSDDENWNDLDTYGSWYPVPGQGNVWVPAGVDASWDPFGYGYWGDYPGFGVIWISGYPWGWLPYHCGTWNYFGFGWGWVPGRVGEGWAPVSRIWNRPPGYTLPPQPIWRSPGMGPAPVRLVAVDRGPQARGPWGGVGSAPRVVNPAPLNIDGRVVDPLPRRSLAASSFAGARGTSPGVRAALGISSPATYGVRSQYGSQSFAGSSSAVGRSSSAGYAGSTGYAGSAGYRGSVGYAGRMGQGSRTSPGALPRTSYVRQAQTYRSPHYSPPPHYSAPAMRSSGGGHAR